MKSRNWWIRFVVEIDSFQILEIVILSLDDPIGKETAMLFANQIQHNRFEVDRIPQDSDEPCANSGTHFRLSSDTQACVYWEELEPIEDANVMRQMMKTGAKVHNYNL
jgi:hypothetical protein